jgi:hypothetical protein
VETRAFIGMSRDGLLTQLSLAVQYLSVMPVSRQLVIRITDTTNRAGNDFGPFSAKYSNDSSSTGIQLLLHCLSLYILPPRPDSGDGLLQ